MSHLDENQALAFLQGTLPPPERAAVEGHMDACGECRALMASLGKSSLVATPTGSFDVTVPSANRPDGAPLQPGDQAGRYQILRTLGSGGMGVVYAAQDPELHREVAVKVLRGDAPTSLLAEAQAMARVAHPNVVHVYDAGRLGDRVFLTMEKVDGVTLRAWLLEPRSWREVLRAFRQAADGLAAVHREGFVHRDFKPDNVLVGQDGRARVTDFGLARPRLTGHALAPVPGQAATAVSFLAGTPAYMAPEVATGGSGTFRSDQFSFCVALFEAFTGERPFSGDTLDQLVEAIRAGRIRPWPEGSPVPAPVRSAIARGLAAGPPDRFASIDELGAALDAAARPRGRRWPYWAGAGGFLALGAVVAAAIVARPPCRGAPALLETVWGRERKAAVRSAILASEAPGAAEVADVVEKALDRWGGRWIAQHTGACEATRLRGDQSDEVLTLRMHCLGEKLRPVAALATELSRATKDTAGRAAQAAAALPPLDDCGVEQVLAAKLRPPPPEIAPKVSALRERLASGQAQLWLGRYPEGLQIVDGATAEAKVLAYRQVQAEILQLRGALLESLTRFTEAEIAFQEGIAAAEAAGSPELALRGWVELGYVQGFFLTRAEDSGRSLAHAQAVLEAVGRAPRAEARLLEVRGLLLKNAGKLDEAAEALGKSLAINEERLGKEDVALASTLLRLSETVREQGDQERSLHLSERARALREKALGESHPGVAEALALSGFTLFELGRFDESEADFRRALVIIEARSGKDHPNAGNALSGLAGIYIYTGRFADALPLKERALAISAKTYGPDSPDVATDNEHLATIYLGLNRLDEAAGHAEKCVELMKAMGMDNPYRVTGLSVLADVRRRQGKLAESRALFEEAGAIERKATGEARPELVEIEQNLGRLALLEGKAPAALPHLETSARLAKKLLPESHPGRVPPLVALGEVYGALKRPGDAVAPLEEALASPAPRGALGEDRARAELGLGRALWSTGKDKERAQDLAKAAKRDLGALPRTPEISKLLEEAEKLLAMMQKSA